MNLAQVTHTPHQADSADDATEQALRFAELAARSGLDPHLADRLATHPTDVLGEFGVSVEAGQHLTLDQPTLVIEDLWAGGPRGVVRSTTIPSYAG